MLEPLMPFHPRLVHFAVALSLVGVLFRVLGLVRGQARWTDYGQSSLILGWLGTITAIITGLIDQSRAPQNAAVAAATNQHITVGVALLVTLGMAIYWPLRNKRLWSSPRTRWFYLGLLLVIVLLVLLEGWLGGKLVYQFRVGVK